MILDFDFIGTNYKRADLKTIIRRYSGCNRKTGKKYMAGLQARTFKIANVRDNWITEIIWVYGIRTSKEVVVDKTRRLLLCRTWDRAEAYRIFINAERFLEALAKEWSIPRHGRRGDIIKLYT